MTREESARMTTPVTVLLRDAAEVLTLSGPSPDPARPTDETPLAVLEGASVAFSGDRVVAIGPTRELLEQIEIDPTRTVVIDAKGCVIAPGLVDAHTHALFVGHRADEFVARIEGASYAEIAARGGGIARSVRSLREATDEQALDALRDRLVRMGALGVTMVEVKTGYGLDTASELRAMRLIREGAARAGVRVRATFLPLHAVDPALRGIADGRARFLERTLRETAPAVLSEQRPDFVDAYVDEAGFSVEECRPLLTMAARAGVKARLHVGQFSDIGGAHLAAELGAASADHLEHVSDEGLVAMGTAGVVGTLLPGAAFSLGQAMPDARRMRSLGVEVALATDCNPGTSYVENLPLMAAFAVRQMGLSTVEAWWALTRAPARSLGWEGGQLRLGGPADACVLEIPSWRALPYAIGSVRAKAVVTAGRARTIGA
jgi:imidazolonepropionase